MIEIQNVSFEYEKSQGTLSHIDLNIQQGECIVLTGESGCGPTPGPPLPPTLRRWPPPCC